MKRQAAPKYCPGFIVSVNVLKKVTVGYRQNLPVFFKPHLVFMFKINNSSQHRTLGAHELKPTVTSHAGLWTTVLNPLGLALRL